MRHVKTWIPPLIIGALCSPVVFWAMDRNPPFIYEEVRVLNTPVPAGQVLKLQFRGTRTASCPVKVSESIVDAKRAVHQLVERPVKPNKIGAIDVPVEVPIPAAAASGLAVYQSSVEYRCNPWQRWVLPLHVERPDIGFEILPGLDTQMPGPAGPVGPQGMRGPQGAPGVALVATP